MDRIPRAENRRRPPPTSTYGLPSSPRPRPGPPPSSAHPLSAAKRDPALLSAAPLAIPSESSALPAGTPSPPRATEDRLWRNTKGEAVGADVGECGGEARRWGGEEVALEEAVVEETVLSAAAAAGLRRCRLLYPRLAREVSPPARDAPAPVSALSSAPPSASSPASPEERRPNRLTISTCASAWSQASWSGGSEESAQLQAPGPDPLVPPHRFAPTHPSYLDPAKDSAGSSASSEGTAGGGRGSRPTMARWDAELFHSEVWQRDGLEDGGSVLTSAACEGEREEGTSRASSPSPRWQAAESPPQSDDVDDGREEGEARGRPTGAAGPRGSAVGPPYARADAGAEGRRARARYGNRNARAPERDKASSGLQQVDAGEDLGSQTAPKLAEMRRATPLTPINIPITVSGTVKLVRPPRSPHRPGPFPGHDHTSSAEQSVQDSGVKPPERCAVAQSASAGISHEPSPLAAPQSPSNLSYEQNPALPCPHPLPSDHLPATLADRRSKPQAGSKPPATDGYSSPSGNIETSFEGVAQRPRPLHCHSRHNSQSTSAGLPNPSAHNPPSPALSAAPRLAIDSSAGTAQVPSHQAHARPRFQSWGSRETSPGAAEFGKGRVPALPKALSINDMKFRTPPSTPPHGDAPTSAAPPTPLPPTPNSASSFLCRVASTPTTISSKAGSSSGAEKRRRAIRELVETESIYARDLAVARDIYLAKAKGEDVGGFILADHFPHGYEHGGKGTSADAGEAASLGSPRSPSRLAQAGVDSSAFILPASPSSMSSRSPSQPLPTSPNARRKHAVAAALGLPRRKVSATHTAPGALSGAGAKGKKAPVHTEGVLPLTVSDRKVVFGNLDEAASVAEAFAALLEEAARGLTPKEAEPDGVGGDEGEEENQCAETDTVGACSLEMLSRLESVFKTYCARYDASSTRLQELSALPQVGTYLAECSDLARGRTGAWDLPSLLIKPVQRCLKYPLLLQQIISYTDEDHPDYQNLEKARRGMIAMADHINESKRRQEYVERIIGTNKYHSPSYPRPRKATNGASRRAAAIGEKSVSGMAVTAVMGHGHTTSISNDSRVPRGAPLRLSASRRVAKDELFDHLAQRVEETLDAVRVYKKVVTAWLATAKVAGLRQVALLERWEECYRVLPGEGDAFEGSAARIRSFTASIAQPGVQGIWECMIQRFEAEVFPLCDQLIELHGNPLSVIARRNSKTFDARHNAGSDRTTIEAAKAFNALNIQLLEELPKFLAASATFFAAIVQKGIQVHRDAFFDYRALLTNWTKRNHLSLEDCWGEAGGDVVRFCRMQQDPIADLFASFESLEPKGLSHRAAAGAGLVRGGAGAGALAPVEEGVGCAASGQLLRTLREGSASSSSPSLPRLDTAVNFGLAAYPGSRRSSSSASRSPPLPTSGEPSGDTPPGAACASPTSSPLQSPVRGSGAGFSAFHPRRGGDRDRPVGAGGAETNRSSVVSSAPSFTFSGAGSHRTVSTENIQPPPPLPPCALWQAAATAVVKPAREGGREFLAVSPGELMDVWREEQLNGGQGPTVWFGQKEGGAIGWVVAEAMSKLV